MKRDHQLMVLLVGTGLAVYGLVIGWVAEWLSHPIISGQNIHRLEIAGVIVFTSLFTAALYPDIIEQINPKRAS